MYAYYNYTFTDGPWYDRVITHIACPIVAHVGFAWASWARVGMGIMRALPCWPHQGVLWATHTPGMPTLVLHEICMGLPISVGMVWVAQVEPKWVLCGQRVGFWMGSPIWAPCRFNMGSS